MYNNSRVEIPCLPKCPSLTTILRSQDGRNPAFLITLSYLKKLYKEGFNDTTKGNFKGALLAFQKCIQHAALSVAENTEEEKEIKKLINNCVEYILAMKLELKRRDKNSTKTEVK